MNKLLKRKDYEKWFAEIPADICTFCEWRKYQMVIKEGYEWVWIANIAPYWKRHTLLLPKRHFESYGDMSNGETIELRQILKFAMEKYEEAGYNRFIHFWRKRPMDNKQKKVKHFHIHLCDDYDGLWDNIVDKKAVEWDVDIFK